MVCSVEIIMAIVLQYTAEEKGIFADLWVSYGQTSQTPPQPGTQPRALCIQQGIQSQAPFPPSPTVWTMSSFVLSLCYIV